MTLKKHIVRGSLQDKKVPGTSSGTRVAAAPGSVPARTDAGLLEESWVNGSRPCQTRFEWHQDRPGSLKSQGGE